MKPTSKTARRRRHAEITILGENDVLNADAHLVSRILGHSIMNENLKTKQLRRLEKRIKENGYITVSTFFKYSILTLTGKGLLRKSFWQPLNICCAPSLKKIISIYSIIIKNVNV